MSACHHLVELGRRQFLRGGGAAAAAAVAVGVGGAAPAQAAPPLARVSYPSNRLANVKDLKPSTSRSTSPIRTPTRPAC